MEDGGVMERKQGKGGGRSDGEEARGREKRRSLKPYW